MGSLDMSSGLPTQGQNFLVTQDLLPSLLGTVVCLVKLPHTEFGMEEVEHKEGITEEIKEMNEDNIETTKITKEELKTSVGKKEIIDKDSSQANAEQIDKRKNDKGDAEDAKMELTIMEKSKDIRREDDSKPNEDLID